MADDALDGALGGAARPVDPGSMADLVGRAKRAGWPTLAVYVDALEAYAYEQAGARWDEAIAAAYTAERFERWTGN